MTTAYTASSNIASLKLKAWTSSSGSLSDPELLSLLEDALRSYVVPFLKRARDEWFVKGGSTLTPAANGRLTIPNSVASTVRTVSWVNNGVYVPLTRIEPENALPMLSGGGATPVGFVLRGYELQIVPASVGSVQIYIEFMERPSSMVLEEDAGLIEAVGAFALVLDEVPLAWQTTAPTEVDVISGDSPFSALAEGLEVISLVGSTLTLATSTSGISAGDWVVDVGCSPFPNIPIELHPLLQQSTICTLFSGLGDARFKSSMALFEKMERDLTTALTPRAQGNSRPLVNRSGPGWGAWRGWGW